MKVCPSCGTRYTDATLQYCLQDGAPLTVLSDGEAAPDEPVTVVRPRNDTVYPPVGHAPAARPNTGAIVALTVGFTVLLLGLGGLLAWMMFGGNGSDPSSSNGTNSAAAVEATPTPSPSLSPSPTADINASNESNSNALGPQELANERAVITELIADWRSETEAKDIDSYMSRYADTVAYYTNLSASRGQVRRDKQRAFDVYDSVQMEISDINTTIDPDRQTAATTFDKEWEFEGETKSRGKVRSELKLKKIGGEWKITGERDLRVYYIE